MKYLKLSTYDTGGAGSAAVQSVQHLSDRNVNAKLLVLYKTTSNANVIGLFCEKNKIQKFLYRMYRRLVRMYKSYKSPHSNAKYCYYDFQLSAISAKRILRLYGDIPDVIDVYWCTDFVSFKTIYQLQKMTNARVVYSMADNAHLTGGCHYPWDCKGYMHDCFPCPAINSNSTLSRSTLRFKKKYSIPNALVTGSGNDCMRASQSVVFSNAIIKPSVSLGFAPSISHTREYCRAKWSIPSDSLVIFFGALNVNDPRKGFNYLVDALNKIKDTNQECINITLLIAGQNNAYRDDFYNIIDVGMLDFQQLLQAYCASDVFVCPSVEDSGPMMINYAFCCNIPIVAFEMGVAIDLVQHKENGWISPLYDTDDMRDGIMYCLNTIDRGKLVEVNRKITQDIKENKSFFRHIGLEF